MKFPATVVVPEQSLLEPAVRRVAGRSESILYCLPTKIIKIVCVTTAHFEIVHWLFLLATFVYLIG